MQAQAAESRGRFAMATADSAHILLCQTLTSMQGNYSISNHLAGTVHIDRATGALSWDQENLDPVLKRYVKKYLLDEGFIEKAIGMLDPAIERDLAALLKSLMEPEF
jgi:hypothetical protein